MRVCLFSLKLHYKNDEIAKRDFEFTICIWLFGLKLHYKNKEKVKRNSILRFAFTCLA